MEKTSFHANLLRRYFGRDDVNKKAAAETIIDKDDSIGEGVVNSLFHLPTLECKGSYTDVKIADTVSHEQKTEVAYLLYEYKDILTDVPGTKNGVHAAGLTTRELVSSIRCYTQLDKSSSTR